MMRLTAETLPSTPEVMRVKSGVSEFEPRCSSTYKNILPLRHIPSAFRQSAYSHGEHICVMSHDGGRYGLSTHAAVPKCHQAR
jgi:hypothetical protein